jgi:CRISPR-associated endonuclease Cas1/CRISPR-associated protein Cas4
MAGHGDIPLIPLRMLNEFTYCPRLGILEWVEGEWEESADTLIGAVRHAGVDRPGFRLRRGAGEGRPGGEGTGAPTGVLQVRSVELSAPDLGITGKIDLVEIEGQRVQPVDYKKGKRPHTATGAWDPERVQLCAQGLLLRANGYACDSGALYFAGSNERVTVDFDDELVALTRRKIAELRETAASGILPPPLEDSPKCPRCSLVSICLPDETALLRQGSSPLRRLIPAAVQRFPVYVQEPGSRVRKNGDVLEVHIEDEKLGEVRLEEISQLVVFGQGVQVSTAMVHELCRREVPVVYMSSGGWLHGITTGLPHRNIALRQRQYATAADPAASLRIARFIVRAKLLNMRTMLRRNVPGIERSDLARLRQLARAALRAPDADSLLGHEGAGSRVYFENFPRMLKGDPEFLRGFSFENRTRRPPRDRMNALLSFGYSILARECAQVAWAVGLDPYLGYLHAPRYGRPALALDLMEAFRPLIVDSACLTAVNNAEIAPSDFIERLGALSLTRDGRAKFLGALERRFAQEITHPTFRYRISYRRVLEVEARLLGRHLTGELPAYLPLVTR